MVDLPTLKVAATWQRGRPMECTRGYTKICSLQTTEVKKLQTTDFFHQATYFQLVLNAENKLHVV